MQRRSKRVGPYCRSQFSTLFLVLSGRNVEMICQVIEPHWVELISAWSKWRFRLNPNCYISVDPAVRTTRHPDWQLKQLSLAYFQLCNPFLSFKGHRITLLIAQNVAKASIVDL